VRDIPTVPERINDATSTPNQHESTSSSLPEKKIFTIIGSGPFFLTWHESQRPIILPFAPARIPNQLRFNLKP
jgi:hypothetical protein